MPPSPNGLPIASTQSPTLALVESPQAAAGRGILASTLSSARSVTVSRPTTCACSTVSSDRVTVIWSAFAMTCALVTISPAASMMNPEPSDAAARGVPSPPASRRAFVAEEIAEQIVERRARRGRRGIRRGLGRLHGLGRRLGRRDVDDDADADARPAARRCIGERPLSRRLRHVAAVPSTPASRSLGGSAAPGAGAGAGGRAGASGAGVGAGGGAGTGGVAARRRGRRSAPRVGNRADINTSTMADRRAQPSDYPHKPPDARVAAKPDLTLVFPTRSI